MKVANIPIAKQLRQVFPPFFVYKASESRYLLAMKGEGKFKITKLSDFRDIERHGHAVGDEQDGIQTLYVDHFETPSEMTESVRLGFVEFTPEATNCFVAGCEFTKVVRSNTYIYSVSTAASAELLQGFSKDSGAGNPKYNAFARIREPLKFGSALASSLAVHTQSDVQWFLHPCIYAPSRSVYSTDGDVKNSVAITKDPRYGYQLEWRYVFIIASDPRDPFFIVNSQEAKAFVDKIIEI